ncbi:MAG: hypothetical protein AB3X44_04495 [Leptothrix sp. (in: b-proteobacteria)]
MSTQPLLVHLVFHPESEAARELARQVHAQLNGDAMVPGLRVPTVFCPSDADLRPPPALALGQASREVVVVLADDALTIDEDWCRFVADEWVRCQQAGVRFVPIQLSPNAWPLEPRLARLSFARAFDQPAGERQLAWVVRRLVVELCRFLAGLEAGAESEFKAPVQLFLSHTKADLAGGAEVTRQLVECLKAASRSRPGSIRATSRPVPSLPRLLPRVWPEARCW